MNRQLPGLHLAAGVPHSAGLDGGLELFQEVIFYACRETELSAGAACQKFWNATGHARLAITLAVRLSNEHMSTEDM